MATKYHTNPEIASLIDEKLKAMASAFANTGKDSTLKEIKEAYKKEWKLMDEIAQIDSEFCKIIRPYDEKEWMNRTKS